MRIRLPRAQLPDSNTISISSQAGRPDRIQTCDCERTNESSMARAAHRECDTLNVKLAAKDNRGKLLASGKADDALVEDAPARA